MNRITVGTPCRTSRPALPYPGATWRSAAGSIVVLVAVAVVGCGERTAPATSQTVPSPPQPPMPPAMAAAADQAAKTDQTGSSQPAEEKERVKAEVGVGDKTRRLENPDLVKSIILPARVYFRAAERITFEIQIPHAMQLYKALNGHAPRDQKEFMDQIIKTNNVDLPTLRPDERYIYDPKTEQLMIERPANRS